MRASKAVLAYLPPKPQHWSFAIVSLVWGFGPNDTQLVPLLHANTESATSLAKEELSLWLLRIVPFPLLGCGDVRVSCCPHCISDAPRFLAELSLRANVEIDRVHVCANFAAQGSTVTRLPGYFYGFHLPTWGPKMLQLYGIRSTGPILCDLEGDLPLRLPDGLFLTFSLEAKDIEEQWQAKRNAESGIQSTRFSANTRFEACQWECFSSEVAITRS